MNKGVPKLGINRSLKLLREQDFKCIYCRKTFREYDKRYMPTAEHFVPHSKLGGRNDDNICLACCECNTRRGDMDIELFLDGYFQSKNGAVKMRGPIRWYHGDLIKW